MGLLFLAIDAYTVVVLASVILSWIPDARNSQLARWLDRATDPVLAPIRRIIPPIGGFDVSPMVLLVALHFLKRLIAAF